jgi:hypothetical protein
MNQMPTPPGLDELLTEKKLEYKTVMGELFSLCRSQCDLSQFLQNFLLAAVRLAEGQGGGLWLRRGEAIELAFDTGDARLFAPVMEGGEEGVIEKIAEVLKPYVAPLQQRGGAAEAGQGYIGIYVPIETENGLFGILKLVKQQATNVVYKEEVELLQNMTGLVHFYVNQLQVPKLRGRMDEIGKLIDIDREIFSSLDPVKIAFSLANLLPELVQCQRCTVALYSATRTLKIEAITGQDVIEQKSAVIRSLTRVLDVAGSGDTSLSITHESLEAMEEGDLKEAGHDYLEEHPFRVLHVALLETKGTKHGVVGIESAKDESFSQTDLTFLKFVTTQAALALENALLFQGIPLSGTWLKLRKATNRFGLMPRAKRVIIVAIVSCLILAPFVVPVENKISGKCAIQPMHRYYARSKTDGILKSFLVREGNKVAQGSVVALLDDDPYQKKLVEASSRRNVLNADAMRYFGLKQYAEYEIASLKLKEADAEIAFLNSELDKTRIMAEGSGVIITPEPRFLERIGKPVAKGEELIEIGELDRLKLEVAVEEKDIKFIQVGQDIRFLLNSLPEKSFAVKVNKIREKAEAKEAQNNFIIEADLNGLQGPFKPGMEGMARIYTGKASLGKVYFRDMIDWFTMKIFDWF